MTCRAVLNFSATATTLNDSGNEDNKEEGEVAERIHAEGDFPGGTVVKNTPANSGGIGLIPGPGRSHMPWSN